MEKASILRASGFVTSAWTSYGQIRWKRAALAQFNPGNYLDSAVTFCCDFYLIFLFLLTILAQGEFRVEHNVLICFCDLICIMHAVNLADNLRHVNHNIWRTQSSTWWRKRENCRGEQVFATAALSCLLTVRAVETALRRGSENCWLTPDTRSDTITAYAATNDKDSNLEHEDQSQINPNGCRFGLNTAHHGFSE